MKPLAIDLFTGLHGWGEGLVSEGYRVVGFDLEDMCGKFGVERHPDIQMVIQDVLTLHGKQFKDAALIVASPPCQEFSYMAMPWLKAKAKERDLLEGRDDPKRLTALFDACFRIQREACEAAGNHIPLVVESVRGAQKWVGRSRWNFGSFHLWGDVPALMPMVKKRAVMKEGVTHLSNGATNFHGHREISPAWRDKHYGETEKAEHHKNSGGSWFAIAHNTTSGHSNNARDMLVAEGVKQAGISGPRDNGKGDKWFQDGAAKHGSKSNARKAASAAIAKIPFPLSSYIARVFRP